MPDFTPKLFCPLLSTSSKKTYCNEKCMWYVHNDDFTGRTCAVALSLESLSEILQAIEQRESD